MGGAKFGGAMNWTRLVWWGGMVLHMAALSIFLFWGMSFWLASGYVVLAIAWTAWLLGSLVVDGVGNLDRRIAKLEEVESNLKQEEKRLRQMMTEASKEYDGS
jgi:hypothetical protein